MLLCSETDIISLSVPSPPFKILYVVFFFVCNSFQKSDRNETPSLLKTPGNPSHCSFVLNIFSLWIFFQSTLVYQRLLKGARCNLWRVLDADGAYPGLLNSLYTAQVSLPMVLAPFIIPPHPVTDRSKGREAAVLKVHDWFLILMITCNYFLGCFICISPSSQPVELTAPGFRVCALCLLPYKGDRCGFDFFLPFPTPSFNYLHICF